MNKLILGTLFALCLSLCSGDTCDNLYQEKNETNQNTMVSAIVFDHGYSDNGEFRAQCYFESEVTEHEGGVYDVHGTYKYSMKVYINYPHNDCYYIYEGSDSIKNNTYTLSRYRDPSKRGKPFTVDEVRPTIGYPARTLLQIMSQKAEVEGQSSYVLSSIHALSEKVPQDSMFGYETQ